MMLLTKKNAILDITLSLTQVSTFSSWFDETIPQSRRLPDKCLPEDHTLLLQKVHFVCRQLSDDFPRQNS